MPADVRMAQDLESRGRLTEAIDLYRRALPRLPTAAQRIDIQSRLGRLHTATTAATLAKAESLRGTGETLEQWESAIALLESNLEYDDEAKRMSGRLTEYRTEREVLAVKRRGLLDAGDRQTLRAEWRSAISSLHEAQQIKGSREVQEKLRQAVRQRDTYYKRLIDDTCGADDWKTAWSLMDTFRAEEPVPNESVLTSLTTRVEDTRRRVVRREVSDLRDLNKYFSAYTMIVDSDLSGFDDLLDELRTEGSRYYLDSGRDNLSKGTLFHAYIAAVKAKILDPDDDEIFAFHRDCADKVEASTHVQIGIAAFDSPKNEPDAGKEFSDELISRLTKSLPYGVTIIERAKIDEALKEHDRHVDKAAQILGIHLAIVGNVSTLTVDSQTSERENITRVKVGTDSVPNPAYDQYRRRYGDNTSKWPSLPPMVIEKDRLDMIRYRKGKTKMEGVMTVSVRIFTTDKGAITEAETFTVTDSKMDKFQGGVPDAGIEDDPLELPTELTMKRSLRDEAVQKAAAWVLRNFECRQGRYYAAADAYMARRERQVAVEPLAQGYLYCLLAGIPQDDKWARKIRQLVLYDLTEPQ